METYGLRLGPLRFVTALSDVAETLGDQLEQVGPSVIPGDRRPRPFNLEIPVRAASSEADPYAKGMQLRRQVRQLMENTAWRMQGLPFSWDIDPDLDCWLLIGGGDLTEIQDGLTFGEFKLSLADCYIAGRPGTHRQGRRLDRGDRRTGTVPRDTWGMIYSTDYQSTNISAASLVVPGDFTLPSSRPVNSGGPRTAYGSRLAARWWTDQDGAVVSFEANRTLVPGSTPDLDLPDFGSVRLWDNPAGRPGTTTSNGDLDPTLYGWTQVLGPRLNSEVPIAIENGACRVSFLGSAPSEGLLIERWNGSKFVSGLRFQGSTGGPLRGTDDRRWTVIELTPERSVVEIQAGTQVVEALRIVLQRGWTGPRIEHRGSTDSTGSWVSRAFGLESLYGATTSADHAILPWIREFTSGVNLVAMVAKSHGAVSGTVGSGGIGGIYEWSCAGPFALQFNLAATFTAGSPGEIWRTGGSNQFEAACLLDARSVPVLVER